jgi:hypothetical protein
MGAALAIPLIVIAVLALAYVVWALFAAGRGAATVAKSSHADSSGETAAHSSEHTAIRRVDVTPPDQPAEEGPMPRL